MCIRDRLVAHRLDGVEHLSGNVEAVYANTLVNDLAKLLLAAGEHDLKIKLLGLSLIHI